jgi:outer membrane protein
LHQLVFDFGRTLYSARQALATERAANHSYTRAEQDLVFNVKQDYYTYVEDLGLVKVQEADLANRQALLDLAQAQFNAGPGEPSDLLSAQTAVAASVQQLVQARNAALVAEVTLASAMGIDPRTPLTPSTTDEPSIEGSFAVLYQKALQTRPDLLASIQQLRAAGFQVAAAKSGNLPSLSLGVGYSTRGPDRPFPNQSASVSLGLTWSVFDDGLTQGNIMEAQANRETAAANLITTQINIGSQVATAWATLQFAEQQVPVTASEAKNAAESLRIAQGRWQAGVGTFIDVTTAQAALVTAQQAVVVAQAGLNTARAALKHAAGL